MSAPVRRRSIPTAPVYSGRFSAFGRRAGSAVIVGAYWEGTATESEAVSELLRSHMTGCVVELLALFPYPQAKQPPILLRDSADPRYGRGYWPVLRGLPVSCPDNPPPPPRRRGAAVPAPKQESAPSIPILPQCTPRPRRRTPL